METTNWQWQEFINFPNLTAKRKPVVQRGNLSISTRINVRKFRNDHQRARTVHTNRASAGYSPLGKVTNVPKLVRDYKSLKPKKIKHPFFDFLEMTEGKTKERAQIPEFTTEEEDLMALNAEAAARIAKVMQGEKFDHRNKDLEVELKKSRNRMT